MRFLLIGAALVACPAVVFGQAIPCPGGLIAVDKAHCCWPGQRFATEKRACVGAPRCPAGLVTAGETCALAEDVPRASPPPAVAHAPPPEVRASVQKGFTVHFQAKDAGRSFTVTMDDGVGSCKAPCDLAVTPGRHRVRIEGDASYSEDLDFPAAPSVVTIEARRNGRLALGIVGLTTGVIVALGGGFCLMVRDTSGLDVNFEPQLTAAGIIMIILGAGFAIAGPAAGFSSMGHNRLTFDSDLSSRREDPPVRLLSLGVAPTNHGGAMAGAAFAF